MTPPRKRPARNHGRAELAPTSPLVAQDGQSEVGLGSDGFVFARNNSHNSDVNMCKFG